jgi:cytochrome d ubiquinol oxidase subunit II
MSLTAVPLLFVLVGLTLYIVLAGADFGAAIWQVSASQTPEGRRIRDFAHNVMAPVWEANHVWLIFVLTVTWTAYPAAFGSIASTLSVALLLAALGIVVRGADYAVSAGASGPRQAREVDVVAAVSSILTPFALGACLGGIASGRVSYGNAEGDLLSSWLNPTSVITGTLAIAISAYLAAVDLSDDAQRRGEHDLVAPYRRRALGAGTVAGVLAAAGLVVLHRDAHPLYRDLVAGPGLPAVILSGAAGAAALGLVLRERFALARYAAALAVAAIVAGWALAQQPHLLPGLTVDQAAAPRDTLVAVVVAVVVGGIVLFPSLLLLLRLSLGGRLSYDAGDGRAAGAAGDSGSRDTAPLPVDPARAARLSAACVLGGFGLLTVAEAGWAHAIGVGLLLTAIAAGLAATAPALLSDEPCANRALEPASERTEGNP